MEDPTYSQLSTDNIASHDTGDSEVLDSSDVMLDLPELSPDAHISDNNNVNVENATYSQLSTEETNRNKHDSGENKMIESSDVMLGLPEVSPEAPSTGNSNDNISAINEIDCGSGSNEDTISSKLTTPNSKSNSARMLAYDSGSFGSVRDSARDSLETFSIQSSARSIPSQYSNESNASKSGKLRSCSFSFS
jgi:hypothetical protein